MYTASYNSIKPKLVTVIVTPGISPIRKGIGIDNPLLPARDRNHWQFPADRIVIEGHPTAICNDIPSAITRQVADLPPSAQRGLKARRENEMILLDVPVAGLDRFYVWYVDTSPHHPAGVFIKRHDTAELVDVNFVLTPRNRDVTLLQVYRRVMGFRTGDGVSQREPNGPSCVGDDSKEKHKASTSDSTSSKRKVRGRFYKRRSGSPPKAFKNKSGVGRLIHVWKAKRNRRQRRHKP